VVRTYIVPATMKLLGKWNWKAGPLNRIRKLDRGRPPVKKVKDASEE